MKTRTLPPIHQTMGEMFADVVKIVGLVLSPKRCAISAATLCSAGAAIVEAVLSRRLKRTIRAKDEARISAVPKSQSAAKPVFQSNGAPPQRRKRVAN